MEEKVYETLRNLEIEFEVIEHEPLLTVEDAKKINFQGVEAKNLFLKDKKKGKYYLVTADADMRVDMKAVRAITGAGSSLTFGKDEELFEILHIMRGACSPFNLINDDNREVTFVLMKEVFAADDNEKINFHPNVNTKTVVLKMADFMKYVKSLENTVIIEEK